MNQSEHSAAHKYNELETAVLVIILDELFDSNQLLELCSTIGVDYPAMAGSDKTTKIINLIKYCDEHKLTDELEQQITEFKKP